MSKKMRIWLIVGASLILIGCIIFGSVMTMFKWDFSKLSTVGFETNEYEINDEFKNISLSTQTADIKFLPSENSKISVVCYEQKKVKHSVEVKENRLVIEAVDTRKWYEYIGINFGIPKITVYLPKGKYGALWVNAKTGDTLISEDFSFESVEISQSTGDVECLASASGNVKIKTSTGDINLKNASINELDLTVSTGHITAENISCNGDIKLRVSTGKTKFNNITCKNIISSGSTGDLTLNNVIADEKISANRSTGDVKFERCDAAELLVETSTGNVTGSLLTDKVFITETDTGKVNVPKSVTGGRCEIETNTGNINFVIEK